MTLEEAIALLDVVGLHLVTRALEDDWWYFDARTEEGMLWRNSAARPRKASEEAFIRWVQAGAPEEGSMTDDLEKYGEAYDS